MGFNEKLHSIPRGRQSILNIFKKWRGLWDWDDNKKDLPPEEEKKATDRYKEDVVIWDWINEKASEEGKSFEQTNLTPGEVRLGVEFVRNVLNETILEKKPLELRRDAKCELAEFLIFDRGDLGKFCYRLEQIVETNRVKRMYPIVRKRLEAIISQEAPQKGDGSAMKAIDTWYKATGRFKGADSEKEGFYIKIVQGYDEQGNPVTRNLSITPEMAEGKPDAPLETEPEADPTV
jgi:hypothetical protein